MLKANYNSLKHNEFLANNGMYLCVCLAASKGKSAAVRGRPATRQGRGRARSSTKSPRQSNMQSTFDESLRLPSLDTQEPTDERRERSDEVCTSAPALVTHDSSQTHAPLSRKRAAPSDRESAENDIQLVLASTGMRTSWSKVSVLADFVPPDITFIGEERVTCNMDPSSLAVDYFSLYFGEDMFQLIVDETNKYASQYMLDNRVTMKPNSPMQKWFPTEMNEMKCFLGLLILAGIVYKPRLKMYWSVDELYATPIFSQVMRRDRFLLLLKFLHFSDNKDTGYNAQDPNRDRLHKLGKVCEMIRNKCKSVYSPGRNLSLDESLILFKGRLSFKQYIKTKRSRFGIKLYELCTSNGILLDFIVYCGAKIKPPHSANNPDNLSTTELIVAHLMKDYLFQGHCLFIDNFYTTPRLADYLLQKKTVLCGTVRKNRVNFPKDLVNEKLTKGATSFYENGSGVLAVKFRALKDKSNKKPKEVHLLSTSNKAELVNLGKNKDGQDIMKPSCVVEYNHNMGGVDVCDQQLHMIQTVRKTYKWYKKLFIRLMMQCMLASHKLYLLNNPQKKGQVDFLRFCHDVVSGLLINSPKMNRTLSTEDTVSRLCGRHFPAMKESTSDKRKWPAKPCRVCSARGIKTTSGRVPETRWICPDCPSQPGIHADQECFRLYHTELDYSLPQSGK